MKKLLIILSILSLSLFFLLLAVEVNAFNINHFSANIERNQIESITGKNQDELIKIYEKLIIYLRFKGDRHILEEDFNEREILHMEDVKVLFKYGYWIKYISSLVNIGILYYLYKTKDITTLARSIYLGLNLNWIFLGILGLLIYLDFTKYFIIFHEIFFSNDLWLLDPSRDLLIQMLPEDFFISMAKSIGLSYALYIFIIQMLVFISHKWKKKDLLKA